MATRAHDLDRRPSAPRFNVAVVGCGRWGMNYLRVLREVRRVDRVIAFDERPGRLEHIQSTFPDVVTAGDLAEIRRWDDVDAVIVATPASTHYDVSLPLLMSGKHVLLEKPMTTNTADARGLIDAARASGATLAVGHTFLHNAAVKTVKRLVASGGVGRLYYLYSRRTNLGPIRNDVSALWDLAPHDVSIFNFLLEDRPTWVSAVGVRALGSGLDDVGFVALGYADGVVAHMHVSWLDPFKVRELVVVGSEQRIVFDDLLASEPVRVYEKGVTVLGEPNGGVEEFPHLVRDGDIHSPVVEASEPLKNQVREFLQNISDRATPSVDGQVGLEVVAVMEAIDRSLALGGAQVAVEYGGVVEVPASATSATQPEERRVGSST